LLNCPHLNFASLGVLSTVSTLLWFYSDESWVMYNGSWVNFLVGHWVMAVTHCLLWFGHKGHSGVQTPRPSLCKICVFTVESQFFMLHALDLAPLCTV